MKYDVQAIQDFKHMDNRQKYLILQNAKHLITHLYYTQEGFNYWTVTEDLDDAMRFIEKLIAAEKQADK